MFDIIVSTGAYLYYVLYMCAYKQDLQDTYN